MPAKLSDSVRATVTAGLAKLVDEVKKYAPPMYAPTANGAIEGRRDRTTPKTTSSNPNVATTSLVHSPPELLARLDSSTAGRENIVLATIAPAIPPTTCAPT